MAGYIFHNTTGQSGKAQTRGASACTDAHLADEPRRVVSSSLDQQSCNRISSGSGFTCTCLTIWLTVWTVLIPVTKTLSTMALLLSASLWNSHALSQTITATNGDIEPPVISLEAIKQGIAGQKQVFTALVSDAGEIQDVKLYYRFAGQQAFTSQLMDSLGNSAYFIGSVETEADESRAIEYYVQARDNAGNRQIEGFAFEPLVRQLNPASQSGSGQSGSATVNTPVPSSTEPPATSGGFKVWQIVLGVLAVGALAAAAAGSGGDGDSNMGDPDQTIPLTLTVTSP